MMYCCIVVRNMIQKPVVIMMNLFNDQLKHLTFLFVSLKSEQTIAQIAKYLFIIFQS